MSTNTDKPTSNKTLLAVGGTFDDQGGKASQYFSQFTTTLNRWSFTDDGLWQKFVMINGGDYADLCRSMESCTPDFVIWMADVPNDKPKLLGMIKQKYPRCILVSSKCNDNDEYTFMELVARALASHSNLFIEFKKLVQGLQANLYDPLGNCFGSANDPDELARIVYSRMCRLDSVTRVKSVSLGDNTTIADILRDDVVPEAIKFLGLVRSYALKYHELIHGANAERMMGNASFRCERGFPSFRSPQMQNLICVSQRNVDKRVIECEDFVPVDISRKNALYYFGQQKPSVDAPVQAALYRIFPHVNYMLHSHVYIVGAPFTKRILPCGAMEEVQEILNVMANCERFEGAINLRGHGSIVLASKLEDLHNIAYYSRTMPEIDQRAKS